ncbi:MAG: gamma carbonic anhydrase family protein [Cryobacterium sp.]|nr:gamma carbonic anhydrase family protein [Oligoflexia bacterium]
MTEHKRVPVPTVPASAVAAPLVPLPLFLPHHGKSPIIDPTAFIAPTSAVIGEVEIGADSSVWFQCVIRGDVNPIRIGRRTNIQDHSMLHVDRRGFPLILGDEITVGHRVMLHGCTIGNRCLIGMGAIIMNGAVVGEESIVGAGALITEGKTFPPRSLIMGMPAKAVRALKDDEIAFLAKSAKNYVGDSREYLEIIETANQTKTESE